MTTERFYLNHTGASRGNPVWSVDTDEWNATIAHHQALGTVWTSGSDSSTAQTAYENPLHCRWVGVLDRSGTWSGSLRLSAYMRRASSSGVGPFPRARVYIRHADGSESLLADAAGGTRLPTSWTRTWWTLDFTAVTITPGDYLAVEVGSVKSGSVYSYLAMGSTTGVDVADGDPDGAGFATWMDVTWNAPPLPAPTGLAQTGATPYTVTVAWSPVADAVGYEWSTDGETWTAAPTTSATVPGLGPASAVTVWVRAVGAGGPGAPASITAWTAAPRVEARPLLLLTGPEGDIDLGGDAFTITARRGGSPDLPTPRLEAGWISATVTGARVRPDTHPEARPGRPLHLVLYSRDDDDVEQRDPVTVGTITAARIEYPGKLDDRMRVVLEAVDVLGVAAGIPSAGPLRGGRFADRIADVLDPAGLPAVVTDTTPPATGTRRILPGDPASVLEHLTLIRDTTHGSVTTTRAGAIRATADRDRPALADPPEPAFLLTDAAMPPAGPTVIRYTDLQPDFDTTHLVNVVTVTTEGGGDATYSIPESVTEWGPAPAAVTVNEGRPGGHAARHMAERVTPRLTVTRVVYDATDDPRQALTPELGDVCRIQRANLVDDLAEVTAIEHTITATTRGGGAVRWSVALELRPLVIPPHRWADVPDTVTWADVPPDLTWTTAAAWRP